MPRHATHLAAIIALTLGVAACAPAAPTNAPVSPPAALPAFEIPAPATPEQRVLGGRQVEELDRMLALDARCGWLDPAAHAALSATAAERRAWLAWQEGAPAAAAQAGELACDNPQLRTSVQYGAWQMRVTWALRAYALLDGGDRPAWLSGLSSVGTQRAVLQAVSDGLDARYAASIQQVRPGIEQEAQQMLAARCPAKAQADACPTLPRDEAFAAYAETWLEQAEAYAAVLATVAVDDRIGAPPADD